MRKSQQNFNKKPARQIIQEKYNQESESSSQQTHNVLPFYKQTNFYTPKNATSFCSTEKHHFN